MKNFKTFGIAFIALFMAFACEKSAENIDQYLSDDELKSSKFGSSGDKMITVPFKSHFYTEPAEVVPDLDCGIGFVRNTQVGGGEATHLGEFTTTMVFCMDTTKGLQGFWPYSFKEIGSFVAANGDELNFEIVSGTVWAYSPGDNPSYIAYFDDEFTFISGTGRFEDATGGGHTNSFTNFVHTDHNWTGTLTLPKGPK
ncbi:MAG: hypothetical protein HQ522_14395 [Bacteroidetes bacterium]|nr:hypothetical protein [Bacteroidota bacterium]